MARIDLEDVGHRYAGATDSWALRPLTMTWNDGGAYALLGPSGCGKTTLLNIISGLITPTRGKVSFDGRDVTALAPEARNIAQVFQFPVVYDTMTVFDNLAFPLRNRGWDATRLRRRVEEVADILELRADLARRARALSADQKQKISLGRGLVRPDVAAVLFDEPLTVIDPHLKWLLRRKLKQIHQQLQLSLLYVTHDQTEALTFADQVVVMSEGEIVQVGTPQQLFETPAHRFVGHFIGSPGMNFLACEWSAGAATIGGVRLQTSSAREPPSGAALSIGVRPEYLELAPAPGPNRVPVRVAAIQDQGIHTMVQVEIGASLAWAKLRSPASAARSATTFAHLPPQRCALYADERRVP
ncbi:MAG TPA: ABC transporter ATP-binding protein [Steroidobacteraceae bacterium]|nr:ABC transporter ATP-binding protein [Steroidobacteraceae bacterium]